MAYGCVRYAHITRAEPRRLTSAFLHCRCQKGKQKHAREGFDFAVPASFSNGFFWAKEVLEAYCTLAPARQRVSASPTRALGPSWRSKRRCRLRWQSCWKKQEEITTYSWRRMAPTVANKGDQLQIGQMAFHCSSAKYAASIKIKSLVWGAVAKLTDQLSWEAIQKKELDKARSHGLAEAERLLRQDRQPIWTSSQRFQDVRKRLKLSRQFLDKKQRQQRHRRCPTN